MNNDYIHQQIDRFFEARLSREEEQALLKTLLKMEGRDPAVDEALAVMLASRMPMKAVKPRKKTPPMRTAGISASIAVILGFGTFLIHQPRHPETFAYVSGKRIQDPDAINRIVVTQLKDIGESTDLFSQTIALDLDDIREALTADDL